MEYTLFEWVTEWLYTYKRIMVKPSTFDSYLDYRKHIKSDKLIQDLTTHDIQKIINDMVIDKKQLSTIKHTLTLVRQSLYKARALGLISNMACMDNLELPKANPKKVNALSKEEVELIVKNSHKTHYGDFYKALLLTGCRVGELIALRWSDIDWFNETININNTDYHGVLQPVKTTAGVRCLPFYGELRSILLQLYCNKTGERVFTNTLSRPIVYRTLLDNWHDYCNTIGLHELYGLHVFRHTFAHMALRAGVPVKVVSAWLGHADVTITLKIYDSVDGRDMRKAAEQLNECFGLSDNHQELFREKQ